MDVRIKFFPKYRDKGICSISDTKWLQEKTINLLDFESDFENKKKMTKFINKINIEAESDFDVDIDIKKK